MPRQCSICIHKDREKINYDLLAREKTYGQIAAEYGLSTFSIRRHVANHLKPIIQKVDSERRQKDEALVLNTLDALDTIISKIPELKDQTNLNHALRALELKARIKGEDINPRITFVWGKGLETDDDMELKDDEAEVIEFKDRADEESGN
jgi:hypothetical protein